jgi:hypothetical protein
MFQADEMITTATLSNRLPLLKRPSSLPPLRPRNASSKVWFQKLNRCGGINWKLLQCSNMSERFFSDLRSVARAQSL